MIPTNLEEMAKLPGLSYTSPLAELGEKFHMAQSLLRRLNPLADFERAGTEILVADVSAMNLRPKQKLTVRSGPNNPVGLVWIELTAPSYGIHGTPQPEEIGKTESHGCIRLTNWDAVDLAAMVRPGTVARFEDLDSPVAPPPVSVSQVRRPETRRQPP